jgi:hypothetical protein
MRIALERICSVAAYGVKISVEANNRVKIFFLIIIEQKLKLILSIIFSFKDLTVPYPTK